MTLKYSIVLVASLLSAHEATAKDLMAHELSACSSVLSCAQNSVVSILPVWPNPASRSEEPEGSGVIVGNGNLIASADHVLGAATKVFARTSYGEVVEAKIVLRDAQSDVALLSISRSLPVLEFSSEIELGRKACAFGNSFGLDVSMSCGVVSGINMSGVGFNRIEDFVQTDAAVNPGMSGGALVDDNGRLVGMLSAIFTKKSDSNIGVNFAVSAALLKRIVDDYQTHRSLKRVSPGILVKPSLRPGETGTTGARVVRVNDDSPENRAGLLPNDVILFAGDRRIKRAGAYTAALALLKKGDSLDMKVLRKGKPLALAVVFD